jgi:hypothetical protein
MRAFCHFILYLTFALFIISMAYAEDYEIHCYNRDSLPQADPLLPADTIGLVLIFYVDGTTTQNCKYDSVDFRAVRRLLPTYARDLVDTTLPWSMVNYYKSVSSDKHIIKGIILPLSDSAYMCNDLPDTIYDLPRDIVTVLAQADQDRACRARSL